MLVLGRKIGEKIVIPFAGRKITITVVEIRSGQAIRLGFETDSGPRIKFLREELYLVGKEDDGEEPTVPPNKIQL